MADILVRGLAERTVQRLKARAKRNGRSLQGEVKDVLERAAGPDERTVAEILEKWEKRFAGRRFSRSAAIVRADRRR